MPDFCFYAVCFSNPKKLFVFPIRKNVLDNSNPNGLYLGTTGSGKSFAAKREIVNVFLATPDKIIIVDPMSEYSPLVKRLGGEVIEISPDSPHHINPLDLKMSDTDEAVYCKGGAKPPYYYNGKRLICSDLKRFSGKEWITAGEAAQAARWGGRGVPLAS